MQARNRAASWKISHGKSDDMFKLLLGIFHLFQMVRKGNNN